MSAREARRSEGPYGDRVTELVGCRHPLQQAAMGGVAMPELAGAVGAAGALGMLSEFEVEATEDRITRALELAAGGAVGMGFFGHWVDSDLGNFEAAARGYGWSRFSGPSPMRAWCNGLGWLDRRWWRGRSVRWRERACGCRCRV